MIDATRGVFYRAVIGMVLVACSFSAANVAAQTPAQEEAKQLRQEIKAQQVTLETQQRKLDELLSRLEALERGRPATPPAGVETGPGPQAAAAPVSPQQAAEFERDPVGDLNADRVRAGETPGSILLPGKGISLAIGGFVKTLAFYDTNAEGRGGVFFPATLGAGRDDRNGGAALSSELSRLTFDARSRVGDNRFRGYIEFDFNSGNFKLRHSYLSLDGNWGQILAGQYWSAFMDTQNLPDALSEPVLSGAPFARQAQIRYTWQFSGGRKWFVSIEDPESNDILAKEPLITRTAWPDIISAFSVAGERSHFQVAGLVRRLTIDENNQKDFGLTGWGIHASGHVKLGEKSKLTGDFTFGRAIGRYLLGLTPGGSAFVIPQNREIIPRDSYGAFSALRHQWNKPCRSTVGVGYASVETDSRQPDNALRSSLYGLSNLMCSVNRYVTIGGEYVYGRRWNRVGSLDNNRLMFGLQVF